MGNTNSWGKSRKSCEDSENKNLTSNAKRSDSGTRSNADHLSVTCSKKKKNRKSRRDRSDRDSENFIVHGLDYLPEFAKRKERRKKNVPKFLLFDEPIWQNNYLNFLTRFQNGNADNNGGNSSSKSVEREKSSRDEPVDLNVSSKMTRAITANAKFSDEKLLDWKRYENYPFRNVVMSGGGSKGYAYIGSLKALEDCGILKRVRKVAGSSAGAICAGLLAVGCSPQEIADVFKCDIKWLFHDQTCACCCCLPRVCNKFGIHPANRFHEIYGEHLKKKVGNPDITFLQLKETLNTELCIVVTNLSRMCSEYFNYKSSPDLPIRDAVRMSMAFPVVFRAVRYKMADRECIYTDGGLLDQYPIHCFDDSDSTREGDTSCDRQEDNNELLPNMDTLGLYVVSEKPIDHKIWQALFGKEIPCKPTYLPNTKLARERLAKEMNVRKLHNKKFDKQEFMDELCSTVGDGAKQMLDHYEVWNKSHVDIRNFGEYFIATIETLLISQRKLKIKVNDSLRTVPINCGYIGTNDYVIEPGDRQFMIDQGYTCTARYLREFISSRGDAPTNEDSLVKINKVPRSKSSNLVANNTDDTDSGDPPLCIQYFLPEGAAADGDDCSDVERFAGEPDDPAAVKNVGVTVRRSNRSLDDFTKRSRSDDSRIVSSEKEVLKDFFRTSLNLDKQNALQGNDIEMHVPAKTEKDVACGIEANILENCSLPHISSGNDETIDFHLRSNNLPAPSESDQQQYRALVGLAVSALGGCSSIPESIV